MDIFDWLSNVDPEDGIDTPHRSVPGTLSAPYDRRSMKTRKHRGNEGHQRVQTSPARHSRASPCHGLVSKHFQRKAYGPSSVLTLSSESGPHQQGQAREQARLEPIITGASYFHAPSSHTQASYEEADVISQHNGRYPAKNYERRPRHKIRKDRYEPKEKGRVSQRNTQMETQKYSRKKAKRRKLGHSIEDGFKAQNVRQERLTLNAGFDLGLFRKGRASSPVRRRELPDLTFSEMRFLSRNDPKKTSHGFEPTPTGLHDPQVTCKTKLANHEASQYFTRPQTSEPAAETLRDPKNVAPQNKEATIDKENVPPERHGDGKAPIGVNADLPNHGQDHSVEADARESIISLQGNAVHSPSRTIHRPLPQPTAISPGKGENDASKEQDAASCTGPESGYDPAMESKAREMAFRSAYITTETANEIRSEKPRCSLEDLQRIARNSSPVCETLPEQVPKDVSPPRPNVQFQTSLDSGGKERNNFEQPGCPSSGVESACETLTQIPHLNRKYAVPKTLLLGSVQNSARRNRGRQNLAEERSEPNGRQIDLSGTQIFGRAQSAYLSEVPVSNMLSRRNIISTQDNRQETHAHLSSPRCFGVGLQENTRDMEEIGLIDDQYLLLDSGYAETLLLTQPSHVEPFLDADMLADLEFASSVRFEEANRTEDITGEYIPYANDPGDLAHNDFPIPHYGHTSAPKNHALHPTTMPRNQPTTPDSAPIFQTHGQVQPSRIDLPELAQLQSFSFWRPNRLY